MPPMQPTSPNWRMADRITGGTLAAILTGMSAEGVSLRDISAELYREHGVQVTHVTVGNWLRALNTPEREAVS